MKLKCPICEKPIETPKAGTKIPSWFPFCSERCKFIDLGKWLDAEYTVPVDKETEDDDQESQSGPQE